MKAVIMAGGRGTRLSEAVAELPKPMAEAGGMPVLAWQIETLRRQGIADILLTVGYKREAILDYFGDGSGVCPATGKPFGVKIDYFVETEPLGNAGALLKMQLTEDFLLLNGDVVFNVDIGRMLAFHQEKGAEVTLLVHPNSHPYDSALLLEDETGAVAAWLPKEAPRPPYYHNIVNAGLHILSPRVLAEAADRLGDAPGKVDLDRQILLPLAGSGKMYCYHSPEYVKDMGTPDRLQAVRADFRAGRVQAGSLQTGKRAVFLDRDGTVNAAAGFIRSPEQLRLLPGAAEAIRLIREKGYLVIIATNQPVIARGEADWADLQEIHKKMETLLGLEGAYIDGLYVCPHHPDRGFPGERIEYKIPCGCRKPKPGLLLRAAKDFNIILKESWMVGDGERDVGAGKAAGCRTALIGDRDAGQEETVSSLLDFARRVLPENKEGDQE